MDYRQVDKDSEFIAADLSAGSFDISIIYGILF